MSPREIEKDVTANQWKAEEKGVEKGQGRRERKAKARESRERVGEPKRGGGTRAEKFFTMRDRDFRCNPDLQSIFSPSFAEAPVEIVLSKGMDVDDVIKAFELPNASVGLRIDRKVWVFVSS